MQQNQDPQLPLPTTDAVTTHVCTFQDVFVYWDAEGKAVFKERCLICRAKVTA